jgi:hypothetical protein
MDNFVDGYHSTFGFPDYGRSNRPDNEFLYEVRRNGKLIVKGESGRMGIGDIRITLKKPLMKGDPAISIKGDVELPTGDAKSGYGSGSIDAGISLLFDKKLSEAFKTYSNIGVVFPGDLRGHERVGLKDFIYGGAAVVFLESIIFSDRYCSGSPFRKRIFASTGLRYFSRGRYYSAIQLSFWKTIHPEHRFY